MASDDVDGGARIIHGGRHRAKGHFGQDDKAKARVLIEAAGVTDAEALTDAGDQVIGQVGAPDPGQRRSGMGEGAGQDKDVDMLQSAASASSDMRAVSMKAI